MRNLAIACGVGLVIGCGGQRGVVAPPPSPVDPAATPPADGPPVARADGTRDDDYLPLSAEPLDSGIAARWWTEAEPCPDGAHLRGAAPPDGVEVWCERADGVKDGPSTEWHAGGAGKAAEGRYAGGDQHGVWTWWSAGDTRWRQIVFDHGVRHGQVILWDGQGQITRVELWERGTRTRATDYEDGRPVPDQKSAL